MDSTDTVGPIAHSLFIQQWHDLRPELMKPIIVTMAPTPWLAVFDFAKLDGSDAIQLTIEVELLYGESDWRWVVTDQHEIGVNQSAGTSKSRLTVDGNDAGVGRLFTISPMAGPWPARLTYTHLRSSNKLVRYALIDPKYGNM